MCSGSEAGSYLRLIDFVYHSTLGLRVIKKKKNNLAWPAGRDRAGVVRAIDLEDHGARPRDPARCHAPPQRVKLLHTYFDPIVQ